MPHLAFTPNLARHVMRPAGEWPGATVREVLEAAFAQSPAARGYVLDDQGAVRKHVAVFVNGELVDDRQRLSDPVGDDDQVFVMQALSGG
ncbi:MAG: MoaD/ThiS family protein [Alphaproteobacteria bacterium]|nr:MoaD/ThiS family protein [Alphaproteobacteria bacterium]